MVNFSSSAMMQIKNKTFGIAGYNYKELFRVCNKLLQGNTKSYKDWDNEIEAIERKAFEGKL